MTKIFFLKLLIFSKPWKLSSYISYFKSPYKSAAATMYSKLWSLSDAFFKISLFDIILTAGSCVYILTFSNLLIFWLNSSLSLIAASTADWPWNSAGKSTLNNTFCITQLLRSFPNPNSELSKKLVSNPHLSSFWTDS